MRHGGVEKNGVIDLDRPRRDNIAEANVYLNGYARSINDRVSLDANSAVLKVFADGSRGKAVDVEGHTVAWDGSGADGLEGICYCLHIAGPIAKKIQVSRGAERIVKPSHKEQGALEDEAVPMSRDTEAVE